LLRHLRGDEPLVLAAAAAALTLDLDFGDLGLEELERLLRALDRCLRPFCLVVGLGGERLGGGALGYGREATRPLGMLAERFLRRPRLGGVTLQGADDPRLFLRCLDLLDLGFALLLRHRSPDLGTQAAVADPRKKEPRIIVDRSRAWKCPAQSLVRQVFLPENDQVLGRPHAGAQLIELLFATADLELGESVLELVAGRFRVEA